MYCTVLVQEDIYWPEKDGEYSRRIEKRNIVIYVFAIRIEDFFFFDQNIFYLFISFCFQSNCSYKHFLWRITVIIISLKSEYLTFYFEFKLFDKITFYCIFIHLICLINILSNYRYFYFISFYFIFKSFYHKLIFIFL